jgi:hypothetical protein
MQAFMNSSSCCRLNLASSFCLTLYLIVGGLRYPGALFRIIACCFTKCASSYSRWMHADLAFCNDVPMLMALPYSLTLATVYISSIQLTLITTIESLSAGETKGESQEGKAALLESKAYTLK